MVAKLVVVLPLVGIDGTYQTENMRCVTRITIFPRDVDGKVDRLNVLLLDVGHQRHIHALAQGVLSRGAKAYGIDIVIHTNENVNFGIAVAAVALVVGLQEVIGVCVIVAQLGGGGIGLKPNIAKHALEAVRTDRIPIERFGIVGIVWVFAVEGEKLLLANTCSSLFGKGGLHTQANVVALLHGQGEELCVRQGKIIAIAICYQLYTVAVVDLTAHRLHGNFAFGDVRFVFVFTSGDLYKEQSAKIDNADQAKNCHNAKIPQCMVAIIQADTSFQ